MNPLKTKAITSCIFATLGNLASQKISGVKHINYDSLLAFGLFGLLFGGPVPHFFHQYVHYIVKHPLGILLIERFIYMPSFQALALYTLSRFEGKTHEESYAHMKALYMPLFIANLKYLTLLQYINIRFVPPMLRVLLGNLIGFLWSIYLANRRSANAKKAAKKN